LYDCGESRVFVWVDGAEEREARKKGGLLYITKGKAKDPTGSFKKRGIKKAKSRG